MFKGRYFPILSLLLEVQEAKKELGTYNSEPLLRLVYGLLQEKGPQVFLDIRRSHLIYQ